MDAQKPFFIWLLNYGVATSENGTDCHSVINKAITDGIIPSRSSSESIVLRSMYLECFEFPDSTRSKARNAISGHDWQVFDVHCSKSTNLRPEYYFRLLEHEELQLARRNSEQAKQQANRAFYTSITAIMISVALSVGAVYWQLNSPITMDHNQLEKIIGTMAKQQPHVLLDPQKQTKTKPAPSTQSPAADKPA